MKTALKVWEMFFNSKVAVTTITLLFGLLSTYTVYDLAKKPDIPQVQNVVPKKAQISKVYCDTTEHEKRDH